MSAGLRRSEVILWMSHSWGVSQPAVTFPRGQRGTESVAEWSVHS